MWYTPIGERVLDAKGCERLAYQSFLSDLAACHELGDEKLPAVGLPVFDDLTAGEQAVALATAGWGLVKTSIRPKRLTASLDEAAAVPWIWASRVLVRDWRSGGLMFTLQPLMELLYDIEAPVPDFEDDPDAASPESLRRMVQPLIDRVSWGTTPDRDLKLAELAIDAEQYETDRPRAEADDVDAAKHRFSKLLVEI